MKDLLLVDRLASAEAFHTLKKIYTYKISICTSLLRYQDICVSWYVSDLQPHMRAPSWKSKRRLTALKRIRHITSDSNIDLIVSWRGLRTVSEAPLVFLGLCAARCRFSRVIVVTQHRLFVRLGGSGERPAATLVAPVYTGHTQTHTQSNLHTRLWSQCSLSEWHKQTQMVTIHVRDQTCTHTDTHKMLPHVIALTYQPTYWTHTHTQSPEPNIESITSECHAAFLQTRDALRPRRLWLVWVTQDSDCLVTRAAAAAACLRTEWLTKCPRLPWHYNPQLV